MISQLRGMRRCSRLSMSHLFDEPMLLIPRRHHRRLEYLGMGVGIAGNLRLAEAIDAPDEAPHLPEPANEKLLLGHEAPRLQSRLEAHSQQGRGMFPEDIPVREVCHQTREVEGERIDKGVVIADAMP